MSVADKGRVVMARSTHEDPANRSRLHRMPTSLVVTVSRSGATRMQSYSDDEGLHPGSVIRVEGRDWLVERIEPGDGSGPDRAIAKPARYRLQLHHPEGREEVGAFRRFRPDRPRIGHAFTTFEEGHQVSWEVVDERLAADDSGEPYLELIAQRDYSEYEQLPDHELEHTLARAESLPEQAADAMRRAERAGLAVELAALEPGEQPDWAEAERYIDALILEEVETDLMELCGVDIARQPSDEWLTTVKQRLRSDLARFRDDVVGDHDQISEWDYRDGRVFASVGTEEQEADPDSGHGWMCRLVDAGVLGVAGFARVRKAELWPEV